MKKVLFLFLSFSTIFANEVYSQFLTDNQEALGGRYHTFQAALSILHKRAGKVIVETGTSRGGFNNLEGDGCSTIIFTDYAQQNDCKCYSVDIDPIALNSAKNACIFLFGNNPTKYICSDSIKFLKMFPHQIDLLYLDSYDYDREDPNPSQMHHLNEIKEIYHRLTENSIVMIDDCNIEGGGKGPLVVEFLTERGWKLFMNRYQIIMIHNSTLSE